MAANSNDECLQHETVIHVGAPSARTYINTMAAGLVALLVRFLFIDRQSFHVDELLDRNVADLGWAKIFDYSDGFPPGYYYIEKAWITLFGSGSIRELALLVGMLGWLFLVAAAGQWFGARTMHMTAWVAALAPTMVWLSNEMRPHSMLVSVAAAALWAAGRLLAKPSRSATVVYGVTLVVGAWIHYFFIPLAAVLTLMIFYLLRGERVRNGLIAPFLSVVCAVVPLILVVSSDLGYQQDEGGRGQGLANTSFVLLSLVTGATLGPALNELRVLTPGEAARRALPWVLLLGIPASLVARAMWMRRRDVRLVVMTVVFVFTFTFVTAITTLAGTGIRVRYVLVAAAPLALVVSATLSSMSRWPRVVASSVLVLTSMIAIYNRNFVDSHRVPDLRAAAHWLRSADPDAVIVINQDVQGFVLDEYLKPRQAVRLRTVLDEQSLEEAMRSLSGSTGGAGYWFVYSLPWFGDPHGLLLRELTDGRGAEIRQRFPWVDVYWVPGGAAGSGG